MNTQVVLSQIVHKPAFPLVNTNVGSGQNMLVFTEAPVLQPSAFFRPWTWGYFIGIDSGLAWSWWWRHLGLIYSSFLLFMVLSGRKFFLSLILGFTLCFSAFVQFWSANDASCQIAVILCCVGFFYAVKGSSRGKKLAGGALLGWAGGCFLNCLYPAYLIPLAYYFLAVALGFLLENRMSVFQEIKVSKYSFGLGMLIAIGVFTFAAVSLYSGIKDVMPLISNSAYPGKRFETGGNATLGAFFSSPLIPYRRISDWFFLGNICEASGFLFIFPGIVAFVFSKWIRLQRFPGWTVLFLIFVLSFILTFNFFGFSPFFAELTLMRQVPVKRTVVVFGLVEFSLICLLFRDAAETFKSYKTRFMVHFQKYGEIVLAAVLLGCFYFLTRKSLFELGFAQGESYSLAVVFILSIFFGLLLKWPRLGVLLFLGFSVVQTGWFNPLVLGGGQTLLNNPVLQKIRAIDRDASGNTNWAVYGSLVEANLPRLAGAGSLAGVIFPPQPETFKPFDPMVQHSLVYNRYAHVLFTYVKTCENKLELIQSDLFVVQTNPDCPELAAANITHLLVSGDDTGFLGLHRFTKVFQLGKNSIYSRNP